MDNQQFNNVGHSGAWKKFYGGLKTRGVSAGVLKPPPVKLSFEHFVDNWDRSIHSYATAREVAAVGNQEEKGAVIRTKHNRHREGALSSARETSFAFEKQRLAELHELNGQILGLKLFQLIGAKQGL